MRLQSIVHESIVDGPGIRFTVFTQGCLHACPGCHNPQTHEFGQGYEITHQELIREFQENAEDNPLLDGVTISGGEPLMQACELLPFVEAVRRAGMNIWLYSGYTIEEIAGRNDKDEIALIERVDTLVDGKFDLARRTLDERFIGSKNQRIIQDPGRYIQKVWEFEKNRFS